MKKHLEKLLADVTFSIEFLYKLSKTEKINELKLQYLEGQRDLLEQLINVTDSLVMNQSVLQYKYDKLSEENKNSRLRKLLKEKKST